MDLTWFRKPSADQPGTLNLCYNALDRHVIRGGAVRPALVTAARTDDFATLLEHVGALAGALRVLGVGPGARVRTSLDDPADALLAALACLRLGAVHGDVEEPTVLVTSREEDDPAVRVRVLRGVVVADPARDVDWDLAIKAGRDEPAPCVDVAPEDPAWVHAGDVVRVRDAVGHGSGLGRALALLCDGEPVELS